MWFSNKVCPDIVCQAKPDHCCSTVVMNEVTIKLSCSMVMLTSSTLAATNKHAAMSL